jgi:hypothetical protein
MRRIKFLEQSATQLRSNLELLCENMGKNFVCERRCSSMRIQIGDSSKASPTGDYALALKA